MSEYDDEKQEKKIIYPNVKNLMNSISDYKDIDTAKEKRYEQLMALETYLIEYQINPKGMSNWNGKNAPYVKNIQMSDLKTIQASLSKERNVALKGSKDLYDYYSKEQKMQKSKEDFVNWRMMPIEKGIDFFEAGLKKLEKTLTSEAKIKNNIFSKLGKQKN